MPRPGMSDGRCLTNYSSIAESEKQIQTALHTENNAEYRLALQHNAETIIFNMRATCKHLGNHECTICTTNNE